MRELRAGLAEVVKYAVIMDDELFNYLEANVENIIAKDPDVLEKLVRRCCEHKIAVVEEDPEERTDRRAILNYGHTIGHALESLYHRYLHGGSGLCGHGCCRISRGQNGNFPSHGCGETIKVTVQNWLADQCVRCFDRSAAATDVT